MSDDRKFLGVPVWVWTGVQGVSAFLGALLAVGGILWGVVEFRGKLEADRARETLSLLDIWETQGYLDNYRALDQRVQALLADVPAKDIEAAKNDPRILATLYSKVSRTTLTAPGATEDFEDVIYFFERLHICVTAGLCSASATEMFFEDTIASFATVFRQPLEEFRTGPPAFFEDLRQN